MELYEELLQLRRVLQGSNEDTRKVLSLRCTVKVTHLLPPPQSVVSARAVTWKTWGESDFRYSALCHIAM